MSEEQQTMGTDISELILSHEEINAVFEKEITYKDKQWVFGIRKTVPWSEKCDLQSALVKQAPDGKGMVPDLAEGQIKILQTFIKYIKLGTNLRPLQKTELIALPDTIIDGLLEEIPLGELMVGLSPDLKKKFTT